MNKENASKLWKIMREAGDFLKGKLPNSPYHPKGRNPYAHVALEIKNNNIMAVNLIFLLFIYTLFSL